MTVEEKEDFEKQVKRAILSDKWFEGLVVRVKAIDQLGDPSRPNIVRFELEIMINGYVKDLECQDQENDSLPALRID